MRERWPGQVEGGDEGGRIVAQGAPEKVAQVAESYTGLMLKPILSPAKPKAAARKRKRKATAKTKRKRKL